MSCNNNWNFKFSVHIFYDIEECHLMTAIKIMEWRALYLITEIQIYIITKTLNIISLSLSINYNVTYYIQFTYLFLFYLFHEFK